MVKKVIIGLIVISVLFIYLLISTFITRVPELVGKNYTEAKEMVKKEELKPVRTEKYSKEKKETVISHTPKGNKIVIKGSKVKIIVSKGLPRIPNVVGLSEKEAKIKISKDKGAKFSINIQEKYDNNIPFDTVISQDPEGNTFALVGSKVNLVISKGRPVIPDVVGKSKEDAKSVIESDENAGFVFDSIEQYHNTISKGDVISQNPQAGTQVLIGSAVNVVSSKGQPVVPDVVGKSKTGAESIINNVKGAGFVIKYSWEYDRTVSVGNVISQNPQAGTSVNIGSTISIIISRKLTLREHYVSCTCGSACACPKERKCRGLAD